jgi:hypothetical protein
MQNTKHEVSGGSTFSTEDNIRQFPILPVKLGKSVGWAEKRNWIIFINGEWLYGAHSKEDLLRCLTRKL